EDVAEAQYLAEDDADCAEAAAAHTPRVQSASARSPRYAPLARYSRYPLALEEPDEDDSYSDDQETEIREDEENEEMGMYQDKEALMSGLSALSTQPMQPVQFKSAPDAPPAYDQRIIEHAGPGTPADQAYHSSYGRVVPFVPPANGHAHPPTGYYNRVPLMSTIPTTPTPTR